MSANVLQFPMKISLRTRAATGTGVRLGTRRVERTTSLEVVVAGNGSEHFENCEGMLSEVLALAINVRRWERDD
jgi:hypothetical protein